MIIAYVGDVADYLGKLAKIYDANAKLVTDYNVLNLPAGTYYSSLGNIKNHRNFGRFLQQADKIVYAPPPKDKWLGGNAMKNLTLDYLESFYYRCDVKNYLPRQHDRSAMLAVSAPRQTQDKQLWVTGCSISHGMGVNPKLQFGTLLAKSLELPVSYLTHPGSSICWAADQILRSDIRSGDVLVWGLTAQNRLPFYVNQALWHIYPRFLDNFPTYTRYITPDNLQEENTVYRHLTSIFQVIKFCQNLDIKFVLASLLETGLDAHLSIFKNFCKLDSLWGRQPDELFLDLGSDLKHPGPRTHKFYADEILKLLKKLDNE